MQRGWRRVAGRAHRRVGGARAMELARLVGSRPRGEKHSGDEAAPHWQCAWKWMISAAPSCSTGFLL
jgi:hypothetical protein